MALKTREEYLESIRRLNLPVYVMGERVENVDHPIIRPSINAVGVTYEIAQDPQYEDLATTRSHISGNKINRFCHIHQSTDDLRNKIKLLRLMGQKQRPVSRDAQVWTRSIRSRQSPTKWIPS